MLQNIGFQLFVIQDILYKKKISTCTSTLQLNFVQYTQFELNLLIYKYLFQKSNITKRKITLKFLQFRPTQRPVSDTTVWLACWWDNLFWKIPEQEDHDLY